MKIFITFKQSIKAILANKGRSFLTVLGIVIGIASVIALISLGTGVKAGVTERISTLGTTNITIMPGAGSAAGGSRSGQAGHTGGGAGFTSTASTLTEADLISLSDKTKHPQIKQISGQISGSAILKTTNGEQRYTIMGTSETYIQIQNLSLKQGNFFTKDNVKQNSTFIVLGNQMAEDLFGKSNSIGKTLPIEGSNYTVIGVLKAAKENGLTNPNSQAYIPYSAAAVTFKSQNFNSITVQAKDEKAITTAKKDIQSTLLSNHKINDAKLADFHISTAADLLSAVNGITNMLTSLLAGIAAISLVVGGIGIMNIMLVSVTERTREIGLRKAVGAKTIDILSQFILEAIILTVSGGILGIGLGILIGKVITPSIGFTPIVTGNTIFLAVGVSGIVGLIFGVYPAAKASLLNPIDALRYE
jgi:putative ABC transport system permease protein